MTSARDSALDPLFGQPPDKRDLQCRQQLSALMDGCLAADQERFLLRRLQHDAELGQCWERWQIYGDTLRGHAHALLPAGFADRVAAAIAAQDAEAAAALPGVHPVAAQQHRRLRWGGTAALAASVALVAFFVGRQSGGAPDGMQQAALPAPDAVQVVAQSASAPVAPAVASAPGSGSAGQPSPASAVDAVGSSAGAPSEATAATTTTAVASLAVAQAARRRAAQRRAARVSMPTHAPVSDVAVLAAAPATHEPARRMAAVPEPRLPSEPASRPWPKAVLPGLSGAQVLAGYGSLQGPGATTSASDETSFAPFQPQTVPQAASPDAPADDNSPRQP